VLAIDGRRLHEGPTYTRFPEVGRAAFQRHGKKSRAGIAARSVRETSTLACGNSTLLWARPCRKRRTYRLHQVCAKASTKLFYHILALNSLHTPAPRYLLLMPDFSLAPPNPAHTSNPKRVRPHLNLANLDNPSDSRARLNRTIEDEFKN